MRRRREPEYGRALARISYGCFAAHLRIRHRAAAARRPHHAPVAGSSPAAGSRAIRNGPAVLLSISTARTSIIPRLLVGIELEGRVGDAPPRARVERIEKAGLLEVSRFAKAPGDGGHRLDEEQVTDRLLLLMNEASDALTGANFGRQGAPAAPRSGDNAPGRAKMVRGRSRRSRPTSKRPIEHRVRGLPSQFDRSIVSVRPKPSGSLTGSSQTAVSVASRSARCASANTPRLSCDRRQHSPMMAFAARSRARSVDEIGGRH